MSNLNAKSRLEIRRVNKPLFVSNEKMFCQNAKTVQFLSPPSQYHKAGNTKGGNITVPLTSCLSGLESAV
jgi:hypothetical protein